MPTKDPNRKREVARIWAKRNATKLREKRRIWRLTHRNERIAGKRLYRERHPEAYKLYYQKNRERIRVQQKEWKRAHPDQLTVYKNTRKARIRAAAGTFTVNEWLLLKAAFRNTCPACGRAEPEIKLTVDHIVPLANGGGNAIDNIQPLCMVCNSRKLTKIIRFKPLVPSGASLN